MYTTKELLAALARRQPTIVLSTRDLSDGVFRLDHELRVDYDVELIGEVVPYDGGRRRRAMTEADEAGDASTPRHVGLTRRCPVVQDAYTSNRSIYRCYILLAVQCTSTIDSK